MTERESPWKKKPQHTHRPSRAPSPRDIATEEHQHAREHRDAELRLYGVNAVKAAFHRRPDALRKLYLLQDRIPQLQPMLRPAFSHSSPRLPAMEEKSVPTLATSEAQPSLH